MSALTAQFEADVQGIESDVPVSFTYFGKAYIGQQSPSANTFQMADAGIINTDSVDLHCRNSIFNTQPGKNDQIVIADVTYRVSSLNPSPDGVVTTFHLVRDN